MPELHQTVCILDFGSQYTRLIARRIREQNVFSRILPACTTAEDLARIDPIGVILSGGPESTLAPDAPGLDPAILDSGIPILGICYGMQLLARMEGGEVAAGEGREYGPAELRVEGDSLLLSGLGPRQPVWMSHGDRVARPPDGFRVTASSADLEVAAMEHPQRRLFGIQFHPEVAHTPRGADLLRRFLEQICGARGDWSMGAYLDEAVASIRQQVGPAGRVVCGLSGGVDSAVTALLVHRAVGERLLAVFVDNGLLRRGESEEVMAAFGGRYGLRVIRVDAAARFLEALRGVEEPEEKRRRVGRVFIEVFDAEAATAGADFLAQGTLYPDVIESAGAGGGAAVIKTHHNVGGLPAAMRLELVEPLRLLFKDEVRRLGQVLGLDAEFVNRHPFPGPGLAVRVIGEVTPQRLELLRAADRIFVAALRREGLYHEVAQAFAVLLPVRSVGVMGDARSYENVVALRAVTTSDFMTADWARLPDGFLARVANDIVNRVPGLNRVVYDITSKPPATIEWE